MSSIRTASQIIACEDSSTFPTDVAENASVVERLGPDLNPNLERVIELEADLILSSLVFQEWSVL